MRLREVTEAANVTPVEVTPVEVTPVEVSPVEVEKESNDFDLLVQGNFSISRLLYCCLILKYPSVPTMSLSL